MRRGLPGFFKRQLTTSNRHFTVDLVISVAVVPLSIILYFMKQKTKAELIAEVRRHTTNNRREIEHSIHAECVSCCAKFGADHVISWKDEKTGKCPRWGEPTVIGSSTGLLVDQAYVPVVHHILAEQKRVRNNG